MADIFIDILNETIPINVRNADFDIFELVNFDTKAHFFVCGGGVV